jgi:hypothetical protein
MFRILYRFLTSLARLTSGSGRSKDLEIIVLRHQLGLPRRQAEQAQLTICMATTNPTGAWTTQAARNLPLAHSDQLAESQTLRRDLGSQFIDACDEILRTEGLKHFKTPVRTLVANTSRNAGSNTCDANYSTEASSGTNTNPNNSSSTRSTTATPTGPTAHSARDHRDRPCQTSQQESLHR